MTTNVITTCKPSAHDFVPKRQENYGGVTENSSNITEVFCRKCGTVCFLTTQPAPEPSRIALARPS